MHSSPLTVTLLPPSRRNAHTNSASVSSEVKALIVFVEVQYRHVRALLAGHNDGYVGLGFIRHEYSLVAGG